MSLRLALVLFLLSAGGAAAATVPVRAGRHDGFTRLVFDFPAPVGWRVGRIAGGYGFLAEGAHAFDLARARRQIGRGRVTAVTAGGPDGAVTIGLGCDCHADAFELEDGRVVIDIHDGPPAGDSSFEVALAPPARDRGWPRPKPRPGQGDAPVSSPKSASHHPNPFPKRTPRAGSQATLQHEPPPPELLAPDFDTARHVAEARSALARQLGRAASQGLVETEASAELERLATPPPDPVPADPAREADPAPAPIPALPPGYPAPSLGIGHPAEAGGAGSHLNLRAQTSVDRDRPARRRSASRLICLDPALLDVAAWGDADQPAAQIASRRAALLGEFDAVQPGAAAALVRLYIHLGFGAEAVQVIEQFGDEMAAASVLRSLAAIVDHGRAPQPNPISGQIVCPGPAAFWSLMARERIAPGTPVREGDMIRSFSTLPLPLRRHLGPIFASRLLAGGHADSAEAIRAAIDRAGGEHGPGYELMSARLDQARDRQLAAAARYAQVAETNDALAPVAVVELVDHLLAEGLAIPGHLVQTAGALAFEHRHDALGPALKRAELLAMADNSGYLAAFEAYAEAVGGRAPPAPPEGLLPELIRGLVEHVPDAALVPIYFRHRARIGAAALEAETRRALAARLAGAGLPETALAELPGTGPGARVADRLQRAEILIAMDEMAAALAELAHVAGNRAEVLRRRALERREDYDSARAGLDPEADPARYRALSWRAGDWRAVRAAGDDTQRAALALTEQAEHAAQAPDTDTAPSLTAGRALLQESAAARETLRALFDAYPAPDADVGG